MSLLKLAAERLLSLLPLISGVLIGFLLSQYVSLYSQNKHQYIEIREGKGGYTNPLLECDVPRDAWENEDIQPFKHKVEDFIQNRLNPLWTNSVAVYYRSLNSGLWFSIGPTANFSPASLLKVPVMMAILKESEYNPSILKQKFRYSREDDLNVFQNIKPSRTMQPGREYTVEDLLYRAIVYSDNNASVMLEGIVDMNTLKRTYNDLGMESAYAGKQENFMSVEAFASFFRVLYNASYLNKAMSEKALDYLAKSEFKDGLVAGVPEGTIVAHKFGEHLRSDAGKEMQLHDCGIVYYPNNPYLLCIMTRGKSFEYLDDAIKEISRLIFEEMQQQTGSRIK